MADKLIIDCASGEESTTPLTAAETTEREAVAQEASRENAAREVRDGNRDTIRRAVRSHLADLRTIRDSTGQLTNAQLSQAVRALAKGQMHVIRLLVDELDAAD